MMLGNGTDALSRSGSTNGIVGKGIGRRMEHENATVPVG